MEAYQEELAEIKTLLRKDPRGMTIKEISHEIGINRNSVAKYMEMLLVSGQAEMKRVGRAKIYFHSQRVPVSALLDYSSEYIIVVNGEGRITLVNDGLLRWTRREREDFIGKTLDDAPRYISDIQDLRDSILLGLQGQASNQEILVTIRGETQHFRVKTIPTTYEDGEIGATIFIEDITERKRMLEELLIKDHAMESSINAFVIANLEGALTYVNPSFLELLGYEDEGEFLGRPATDLWQPEERALKLIEALQDTGNWRGELVALRKDGSTLDIELTANMVRDETGNPLCMMASFLDVTERKGMERELQTKNIILEAENETTPDGILVVDEEGRIVQYNRLFAKMWDVPEKAFQLGTYEPLREIALERVKKPDKFLQKVVQLYMNKDEKSRDEVELKDGTVFDQFSSPLLGTDGKNYGRIWFFRDITERKLMEEELKNSEERWRSLVELAPDGIITMDLKGVITSVNTAEVRSTGYSKDEFVGKHFTKLGFFHARDTRKYMEIFGSILKGEMSPPIEVAYTHKDGTARWAEAHISLLEVGGEKIGIQAIMRDITERKQYEKRLEALHKHATELGNVSTMEEVAETTFNAIEQVLGFDMVGFGVVEGGLLRFMYIMGVESDEVFELPLDGPGVTVRVVRTGETQIIHDVREDEDYIARPGVVDRLSELTVPVKIDGEVVAVINVESYRLNAFTEDDRRLLEIFSEHIASTIGKLRRVEELRKYSSHLEEIVEEKTRKLLNAERMVAIGETAAMVGHDLRNPLQVIFNALYLLKEKADSSPIAEREIMEKFGFLELGDRLSEQVEYMDKIVSDLQDYARPLKIHPQETSIHQLINDTLSTITVPEAVEESIAIEEGFPKLMIDPGLMRRVLTNLVTNALQAMPEGGQLKIRASHTEETATISVQDTGAGIPEENQPKLFQPLFTTKPKGQGLGLPVCRRLVEAHGGSIAVETDVGKGSTFTVQIPLKWM